MANMRVCLFTDTLADVNGVSRFIRGVAEQALLAGRDLHVITSTRLACPDRPNIHNVRPRYARAMPGYPQLDLVVPDHGAVVRLARELNPDVIHVSTPGPVGLSGRRVARLLGRSRGAGRRPLVGTYHTDFPAYVEHLFAEPVYTWACSLAMRRFYRPFSRIFTRSEEYAAALHELGIAPDRVRRLLPGIDTEVFHTRHRDGTGAIWSGCPGVRPASAKAIYVGRVSVEKNLPMLARLWPRVRAACAERGVEAQLLVVGDGPYRKTMEAELAGAEAVFLGFRHGVELSTIYASSDLFIFPSTTDTLGQVVMEAQSTGLPVLVTDRGGPAGVVDDGVTGFVLPATPGASGRWIEAAARILTTPELRRRMGAAGHAKIQPMSIRNSFDDFWKVHEEVAHRPGNSLSNGFAGLS